MRSLLLVFTFSFSFFLMDGQTISLPYETGDQYPFGRVDPEMSEQLSAFAPMIGICDCKSNRRAADGSWKDTVDLLWQFKYILNGTSIQDDTWKSDGTSATSIRQYVNDSIGWAVTYFSMPLATSAPGTWTGHQVGDDVVLSMPQSAPNGMEGFSRLTFYNISDSGFDWVGEWLDKIDGTGQVVYPFWKIHCIKKG